MPIPRRIPFVLDLESAVDNAIWEALKPLIKRRKASQYIKGQIAHSLGLVASPYESLSATLTPITGKGVVYLLGSDGGMYKVGRSNSIDERMQAFATLPYRVTLLHTIECNDMDKVEFYWHTRFAHKRVIGEWFKLTSDEINEFKSYVHM